MGVPRPTRSRALSGLVTATCAPGRWNFPRRWYDGPCFLLADWQGAKHDLEIQSYTGR